MQKVRKTEPEKSGPKTDGKTENSKERNVNGILNIYKPQDMTSHDVIAILRKASGVKKSGHTGTLDPMATGVLPVCMGSATRIMEYLDADMKEYSCTMRLGFVSDTDDIWGEVTEEKDPSGLTDDQIKAAVEKYRGKISQIPPVYSALKVNGRKLYQYARDGQDVKIRARQIYIDSIVTESISRGAHVEVAFSVRCSKGTYIRSLCRDIGEDLGCGAVMNSLERKASGIFRAEEAVDIEKIRSMAPEEIEKLLIPADKALAHFGKGIIRDGRVRAFLNGLDIYAKDVEQERKPLFSEEDLPFYADDRYTRAWCLYGQTGKEAAAAGRDSGKETGAGRDPGKGAGAGERPGGPVFLGVAMYEDETDSFRPDKVFFRG